MMAEGRMEQALSKPNNTLFLLAPLKMETTSKFNIAIDLSPFSNCLVEYQGRGHGQQTVSKGFLFRSGQDTSYFSKKNGAGPKVTFMEEANAISQQSDRLGQRKGDGPSIMQAKPIGSYCQICGQNFDDYLQHIEHPSHRKRSARQIKSCKMIDHLAASLKHQSRRARSERIIKDEGDQDCLTRSKPLSRQRGLEAHCVAKVEEFYSQETKFTDTSSQIQKQLASPYDFCQLLLP